MTYSKGQTVTQKFHLSKICYNRTDGWKLSLKKYESHRASPGVENLDGAGDWANIIVL